MPKQPIAVAVVEDDPRLRRTFVDVLEASEDFRCVGAFATGAEAVAGIPQLQPDVVVMDVNLPDTTGVECVRHLAPSLTTTQILMVTVYQDPETTFQALAAGAHGYLVKPVLPGRLVEAIREVRDGGVPMSRTIARRVIEVFRGAQSLETSAAVAPAARSDAKPTRNVAAAHDTSGATPALAGREQQVLQLLVKGFAYKEIAHELGISQSTVGTYVQRIYEKLHVSSRREIITKSRAGQL